MAQARLVAEIRPTEWSRDHIFFFKPPGGGDRRFEPGLKFELSIFLDFTHTTKTKEQNLRGYEKYRNIDNMVIEDGKNTLLLSCETLAR